MLQLFLLIENSVSLTHPVNQTTLRPQRNECKGLQECKAYGGVRALVAQCEVGLRDTI